MFARIALAAALCASLAAPQAAVAGPAGFETPLVFDGTNVLDPIEVYHRHSPRRGQRARGRDCHSDVRRHGRLGLHRHNGRCEVVYPRRYRENRRGAYCIRDRGFSLCFS